MNYFDIYATIFGYAPHLSTLAPMSIAQAITLIVPFILKAHNILQLNEALHTIDIH